MAAATEQVQAVDQAMVLEEVILKVIGKQYQNRHLNIPVMRKEK